MNTTKFFKTKEQHIAFRKAFATAINDPRAKKGKPDVNGYKPRGWITKSHIMLQHIVRGLPHDHGFTPITKKSRLENGAVPNEAVHYATWNLQRYINAAKAYVKAEVATLSHWEEPKPTKSFLDNFKFPSIIKERVDEHEKARQALIVAKTINHQEQYLKTASSFLVPFGNTFTVADLAQIEIKEVQSE